MATELIDQVDGKTYVLTAPRCFVTWKERNGDYLDTARKRFRRGDELVGVPERQLRKLITLGHAVPADEYDPEKLAREKMRKRMLYDQSAASSAMLDMRMKQAREAGMRNVGLEDAAPVKSEGDKPPVVDGIQVEDVDDLSADQTGDADPDDDLTSVPTNTGPAEDYKAMDYPALQKYAKDVTGNGAGGKEELISRLDEHFAQ